MHHFAYVDGVLHAEGVDLTVIADEIGTPFYCYSTATLQRHYKVMDDAFAGTDVVFVSSGLMTMRALLAAEELSAHNVDVAVVHTPTLKPFDADTVLAEIDSDRLAVTLENHTVVGGLFETVASEALRRGLRRQVTPIALPDEFLAAGALPTLHDRYGLSTARVVAAVLDRL